MSVWASLVDRRRGNTRARHESRTSAASAVIQTNPTVCQLVDFARDRK